MRIKKALFSSGITGFFFDDQRAVKQGFRHDGFTYEGEPVTTGFSKIRQAGESISIMLVLENDDVAFGDAAAVQYSGAGGRDPLFLAATYLPFLNDKIAPLIEGEELDSFKRLAEWIDILEFDGKRMHTAIRYGLSQVFLDAVARADRKQKTEILCNEYNLPLILEPIPLFGQTGDNRYEGVDKMIIKHVDVLPHGLINNIPDKLGVDGGKLREYIDWLAGRIRRLRVDSRYCPDIHIDVYGNIGEIFGNNTDRVADYVASLEKHAMEFKLYIEGPVDVEAKEPQIEALCKIKNRLTSLGSGVEIVADEWCNTFEDIKDFTDAECCHMVQIKTPDLGSIHNIVESILYCKSHGMQSYQGGTCNETDISARTCAHVALSVRPDRMLAKPGMGFDEGYMIVQNEMKRTLTLLKNRTN
ncbi:MAG: methylaspartate ammonia-lyase [Thermodesulfobacteriota bacterium]|nr:methylaspartate ammonia-lyase [Thermodesulfobacteriota bacterium]